MKISSPRTSVPSSASPSSNFVSAMMIPFSSSGLRGGRVELDRDPLQLGEALVADQRGRLLAVSGASWPSAAFVVGVKIGSGSRSDSRRPSGSAIPQTSPLSR